ncbi:MAG: hypothetical protein ACYSSO_04350 [Planctomycetota bacterium]|jgi:hypothetical protein
MVNKDENSEQIDDDILQCKADILRARDIVPPYKKKTKKQRKSQKKDEDTSNPANIAEPSTEKEKTTRKDAGPIPIETTVPKKTRPPSAKQEEAEIPRFDLAEEIMAEQRKITSIRRKSPGKKAEAKRKHLQAKPVSYTIKQLTPEQAEQNRIIAEVVARDIERLCRGGTAKRRG